jgi:hypothetical protein
MAHCCVVFCTNDLRYKDRYCEETGKVLHFHHFPADSERRKKWIVAIRRDEGPLFKVCHTVDTVSVPVSCGVTKHCAGCSGLARAREKCRLLLDGVGVHPIAI